jgi:hypothetical protein
MSRFVYADPPYPGMAHRYGPDAIEVNHRLLIAHLEEFDGWALSTSAVALRDVLNLCPDGTRIAAWTKPWVSFKKGVNPAYAWEPVLFRGARSWKDRGGSDAVTVRDWVSCVAHQKGFFGSKPPTFTRWILDLLGVTPDDDFVDLFPGSGAVSAAHQQWLNERPLPLTTSTT